MDVGAGDDAVVGDKDDFASNPVLHCSPHTAIATRLPSPSSVRMVNYRCTIPLDSSCIIFHKALLLVSETPASIMHGSLLVR
jgi:hypothetical protein